MRDSPVYPTAGDSPAMDSALRLPARRSGSVRLCVKLARNALLALAFMVPAVAFAAIGVNKTFNPTNVSVGQVSTLTVILINNNPATANTTAFTDNLPGTVVIATPANASNTCGGTPVATPGATSFSFSGGTIPAAVGPVAGQCTVQVDVVSPTAGVFINTIPANAVTSSQGNNSQAASATLTVAALRAVTGAKAFLPTVLHGSTTLPAPTSRITMTLTNPNGVALTNATLTDTLPAGLSVAPTPNPATTCGAGTVSTTANSATLASGTIPANGNCTISFDVIAANPNAYANGNVTNTIPVSALTTAQGATNTAAFAANVTLQTGARVEKSFAPTPITTGGTSTLTVTVRNFNTSPLTGSIAFTDTLPIGMTVAAPVTTATTCAGLVFSPVPTAGALNFSVSGGSLPGATIAVSSNTNCTVSILVTAVNAGVNPISLTNTLPVSNFGGVNYSSAGGTLVVNAVSSVSGTKSFSPNPILQGGISTATITLNNSAAIAATITSFTDALTTMGASPQFTVAAAPAATTTCGGAITAVPGTTTVSLGAGNSIPATGSCTITVPVQAAANASTGARTNTIAQGALVTSQGRTQTTIAGAVTVNPVLSVAKAFAPATVAAGGDTRLTITLTRAAGAVDLTNITFTDTLPALHVVSVSGSAPAPTNTCGGTLTATGGAGSVSLSGGALTGATTTCTISVSITTPAGAAVATNTIAANAVSASSVAGAFTNPAAATATITRVVTNVTLNKSFSPATVLVGGVSTMTINILNTNANALALTTTGLVDTLPLGMVVAPAPTPTNSCGGTFTPVAGAGSVTLVAGTLAANATCSFSVRVVANASGNLINTLGANAFTSAQGVTNPLAAQATLAATGSADLQVTKTDGVTTVVPGTTTTYTIVAQNNGPQDVAGAGFADTPPAGMTFTGWTCVASAGSSCGNASGSGPINELVTLLVNGTATYTVTAAIAANATGSITNTATVIVPGTVIDTNLANNSASDTDTLVPTADLSITKTDGVATVVPGTSTTYTIVVSNAGPSNVTGATVADVFPAGITSAAFTATATGGATGFTAAGSGNIADTVNMPVGSTITYTVVANIAANAVGTLANTATVTTPGGVIDPTPGNNSATDTDTLTPTADLQITKTDGTTTAVPGASTTYTIVAFNAGPSSVVGAAVTDNLPGAITSDTFTAVATGGATGFTASGAGNINDIVNMPAGSRITYTVVANISASATGTLVNTATVTAPPTVNDPTPGNNSATDTDTLSATADLSITKTDGTTTATPGATTTYTIVVSNAGPSNVIGATVTDILPAAIISDTFTASATGGATGFTPAGSGNITNTVNMPAGSTITYVVVATISASATGTLVNTATVAAPPTVTDPTPGNNSATDTDTLSSSADLSITKTDGVATVTPGTSTTYTIVVTNAGPSAVTGATVTDTMPAGIASDTFTAVATGGATGFSASGSGNINDTVNLPVGSTITYTVVASISPAATGTLVNTATVTPPGGVTDPTPGNNSATDTDTLSAQADLSITKNDGVTSVVPGTPTTYTIVVTNNGPSNVTGATISDVLPAAIVSDTFTAVATGGATGFTASGSGNINNVVNMPVGSTITYTVIANISASATGTLVNTATVAVPPTVTDPTPGNNTATDTDTLTPQADLAITKTDGVTTLVPGAATTYTIIVSNFGPSNADGAIFRDPAVANLSVTSVICGAPTGGAVCPTGPNTTIVLMQGSGIIVPTLPSGGSVRFTVAATVAAGATGSIANTALVNAPAGVTDPTPANNTATDVDTLTPQADLAITKTDGVTSVTAGGATTYTIVVSNGGLSNADGAIFRDAAIANLTVTGVICGSASGGAVCPAGITVPMMQGPGIVIPTLPAGGSVTFTVTATIPSGATGSISNVTTVSAPAGVVDPTPGNNTATDIDTITLSADLSITKTDGVTTVVPGTTTTYTIVVANAGPSDVTGATVTDVMPAALTGDTFTAVATGGATGFTAAGIGNINDTVNLPVGSTITYTVVASINANATGTLVNTAVVTAPGGVTDPTPGNNSATDTDTLVPQVTLAVVKTDGSLNYTPGGTATYTVTVTNTGASDAHDVTVADLLPAGLTLTANVTCTATGSALCTPVTGSIGGTSFVMTHGVVGAGAGNSLIFTVPVAFAGGMTANPLQNTATATDIATGASASDTDSDVLAPQVSLAVAKTDGSATYTPGGTGTYTVTITHGGLSDATNVTVNDPLPAGVTLTANATCVPIGAASCGTVTGTTGQTIFGATGASIAAGAGNSLVFTAPVAFAANLSTDPLDNTATATDVLSGATGTATDSDTRAPAVTLALTKTDGSATYTPGLGATYVVTVTNTGVSDALNITVADALPTGVTLSGTVTCAVTGSANCGAVTGIAPQTSFATTGARINAGAGNMLTFTVPVAFAANLADNPLVNTVTANDLASGATGTATDSDTLAAQADLVVTKTDGVTSVVPGTPTTYTIVVTNNGPSNVTGATVSDVMPAAVASDTFTTVATGGATGFTASGGGNINDTVNLPAGSTITYTVVANISGSATGTVVNTATVATPPGMTDPTPGNNTATDTDTLTAQADLSISKTDGVTSVVPGTSTTYTIVVTNSGPSNVTGATVSDVMPAAIASDTYTAVATGGATGFIASGGGNINDTVNMPSGSTITYSVVANISASASGTLVNTATVSAPPTVTDTNPGNNTATDTDTLSPQTDLAISKTDGVTSVMQGGSTTYAIVVANNGPSAVTGATVSDPMPAAIVSDTFSAVGSGGASGFTASGSGNINDTVNMPVGSTITYTVVANISASAVGNLVNTATVVAPGGVTDTNPGNNSATDVDTITLIPLADLSITKTDGSATYTPGNPITYTIVAANAGPMGVVGASVTDIVPAVITGATWTCVGASGGTCPASGAGNIVASVNLPAGASVTFTLSGTVAPTATGNLVNTATVATPPGTTDPNPSNNTATDTDTPASKAGLAITKTDASSTYKPGFPGTYTISVTNNGPSNANSVTVTDNLPAGVSLTGPVTCVASGTATCGTITGTTGGTVFQTTGATIAAGAGNRIVFTLPVLFAANMTTNPLTNTATATDPASVSVASASDTNTLSGGPSTPIPVDNGWALALLAGFILLAYRWQSRQVPLRRRR